MEERSSRGVAVAGFVLLLVLAVVAVLVVIIEEEERAAACAPDPAAAVSVGKVPTAAGYNGDQMRNLAIIDQVRRQLGLPARATQIAFMTTLVESNALNLHYGDADSEGLFQQRPSMGWGTPEQITDPVLATRAFFGRASHTDNPGLTDIRGWQTRDMGEVAQAVQVSAFPSRYAARQDEAAALMRRIGVTDQDPPGAAAAIGAPGPAGCTDPAALGSLANCPATPWRHLERPPQLAGRLIPPDALRTLRCGHQQFPQFTTVYTYGQRAIAADEHGTGRAVDWMVPGGHRDAAGKAVSTQLADWLVANAKALGVEYVIWDNRIWNSQRDPKGARFPAGWRAYKTCSPPRSSAAACGPTAAHQDHVHVTLYGNRGVVDAGSTAGGAWGLPLRDNYQLGPGVCTRDTACWGYSGHTGQDFSATLGAPVVAVAGGKVTTAKVICPSLTNRQRSGNDSCSYGRYVVVDHGGQVSSYSAHLDAFAPGIKAGATVRAGQLIGRAGNQGNSDGVHLHFEIRRKGAVVNPVSYLEAKGVKVRCGPQMQGTYSAVPVGGCD